MTSGYSDDDTERARAQERSTAGMETQRLPSAAVPPPGAAPAEPFAPAQPIYAGASGAAVTAPDRRGNLPALALIVLGAVLLLARMLPVQLELTGGMVLLTIASCFLFFSFWRRIYGLLIPGCILAGLSVGVTFADLTNGVSVLWGLSLGFVGILLIGRTLFGMRSPWPIFPAVPLFAVGLLVAFANAPAFLAGGLVWLPLLLIGAGLFLGWGRR